MGTTVAPILPHLFDLTMSDLQAVLWHGEKRLYESAKTAGDDVGGYVDDEAPGYANAAANLARRMVLITKR